MRVSAIELVIIGMVLIWIIFDSYGGMSSQSEIRFWESKEQMIRALIEDTDIEEQESVLYLDPGDASFFIGVNSSCRYISALVISRHDPPSYDLSAVPAYNEEYSCIMAYEGKYIVLDTPPEDWLNENAVARKPIMSMIKNNYTIIWENGFRIFQKNSFV